MNFNNNCCIKNVLSLTLSFIRITYPQLVLAQVIQFTICVAHSLHSLLFRDGRYKGRGHLRCAECVAPHCEDENNEDSLGECIDAVRCFMGIVREADGSIHKSRGSNQL